MSAAVHISAGHASVAAPVGGAASWFESDDYPAEALQASREGLVVAIVTVSPSGRPVGCTIQLSSRTPALDRETCEIAMKRGAFRPARDVNGRALAGSFPLRVRWVLPPDARGASQPAEAPGSTPPTRPHHGWWGRLGEAEHLIDVVTALIAIGTAWVRRWFGRASLDGYIGIRDAVPRRSRRWRHWSFLVRIVAPIALVAFLLDYLDL